MFIAWLKKTAMEPSTYAGLGILIPSISHLVAGTNFNDPSSITALIVGGAAAILKTEGNNA